MTPSFPYAKPADERFARFSGLAIIATALVALCSALVA
jgi:hypothetical protein